jgi:hypothetical protein
MQEDAIHADDRGDELPEHLRSRGGGRAWLRKGEGLEPLPRQGVPCSGGGSAERHSRREPNAQWCVSTNLLHARRPA